MNLGVQLQLEILFIVGKRRFFSYDSSGTWVMNTSASEQIFKETEGLKLN